MVVHEYINREILQFSSFTDPLLAKVKHDPFSYISSNAFAIVTNILYYIKWKAHSADLLMIHLPTHCLTNELLLLFSSFVAVTMSSVSLSYLNFVSLSTEPTKCIRLLSSHYLTLSHPPFKYYTKHINHSSLLRSVSHHFSCKCCSSDVQNEHQKWTSVNYINLPPEEEKVKVMRTVITLYAYDQIT